MRNKNWIEFYKEGNPEEESNQDYLSKSKKINIYTQKKGKKGKTITVVAGLNLKDKLKINQLLKNLKIFCGTGGKINDQNIHLQGDLIIKVKDFLRKEGYLI